jgi:hypothetical protein
MIVSSLEHFRSLVVVHILTGAVRLLAEPALMSARWAVPLVIGLTLVVYHRHAVVKNQRPTCEEVAAG